MAGKEQVIAGILEQATTNGLLVWTELDGGCYESRIGSFTLNLSPIDSAYRLVALDDEVVFTTDDQMSVVSLVEAVREIVRRDTVQRIEQKHRKFLEAIKQLSKKI